ncbi:MAG: DUF5723 family protein [Flavobacteriaceae bacterium]|nr:DUF5723 family protein [Flavobacteriaceae bacterium]
MAQNNQILYGFDGLPQTLMLNPGAVPKMDKHFGVPLLSNVYFQFGVTDSDVTYNNLSNGTDGESDLKNLYDLKLSNSDFFIANAQVEFINVGFRLKNPDNYLSFGMYADAKAFGKYPKSSLDLFFFGDDKNNDGSPDINKRTDFSEINSVGELTGVFHVGISKNINDRWQIGGRLKLLSGSLNYNIQDQKGQYSLDRIGQYTHNFEDMQIFLRSSGFNLPDLYPGSGLTLGDYPSILDDWNEALSGLFFMSGNFGVGIDLGLTHHFDEHITFTASLLDLDYMKYSKNNVTYTFSQENFALDDEAYWDPVPPEEDYWDNIFEDFDQDELIPIETLRTEYNTGRNPKLYTGLKYRNNNKHYRTTGHSVFRNVRSMANTDMYEIYDEFGIQTYTEFLPASVQWGATAFYAKSFNPYLSMKMTYTADNFSYTNIGFGLSTQVSYFNLFIAADNLIGIFSPKDSNYQSVQVGLNIIIP